MPPRRSLLLAAVGIGAVAAGSARAIPSGSTRSGSPRFRGPDALRHASEGTRREPATDAERDADLMEKLGLLDGHLLIGRALLDARHPALAAPHFGHPAEELYGYLAPKLEARGVPPFSDELHALRARADAGDTGAGFQAAWDALAARLAAARASVPETRRKDPAFLIGHIATMVEATADDYAASISRGRIANVTEFYDSAGFLRYAIGVAEANHALAPAKFRAVLVELNWVRERAFPELLAPPRPLLAIAEIRTRAGRIRAIAQGI